MAADLAGVYLRVARDRAWWKLLCEALLAITWWFVGAGVVGALILAAAHAKKFDELDALSHLALLHLMLAMMTPAALLAAQVMGRRRGLLSSIEGRLRWRWLFTCVAFAIVAQMLFVVAGLGLELLGSGTIKSLSHGGTELLAIASMTIALVPFQAAGEEYFNRGTLVQVLGGWGAPKWLAMLVSTAAFVAMHGTPNVGTIAIVAMGMAFAWLTIETGGLEAAIAGHAINNIVAFTLGAAAHGTKALDPQKHNASVGWWSVSVQLLTLLIYTALVLRSWRKYLARTS